MPDKKLHATTKETIPADIDATTKNLINLKNSFTHNLNLIT